MALIWLTRLDWQEKRHDTAVTRVERAMAERPKDTGILLLMAEAYNAAGQNTKVERPLREALQLDPSLSQAYGMLAEYYRQQGRVDESLRELDTVLAQHPRTLPALLLKGVLLQMTSRGAEAIESYRRALDVNSGSVVALNNLAWYYAEKGENLEEALTFARTAKAQNPTSVDVTDTLGWVLYKKGQYDLAIASFREALELSPKRGDVHYHLGLAYAGKGDVARARQTLLAALEHQLSASDAAGARSALKTLPG
jgi:Tfp pilus assembly protein PilF